MEIPCLFSELTLKHGEKNYGCFVENKRIPENQEIKFVGEHKPGKSNSDVQKIWFLNCSISKIPQGLTKVFSNLKDLSIQGSKLKKICKNDLAEYKNFEKFLCQQNELDFLPGDLFEDFKNLEYIDFWGNKLKIIEPNVLDGLDKLNYVDFRSNPNYTKCHSVYPVYIPNATLEAVKHELFEKFALNVQNIKALVDKYQQKIQKFKSTEKVLRRDLEITSKLAISVKKGIYGDLKNFIQDETTKDFKIKISDREFPVHKFLLAARSPTLAEILRKNPEVENLSLVDISVEIFEKILKFLYTDELPREDGTNFLHLFAAAGRLKIEELINYAAKRLLNQIDGDNALEIINLSNKFEKTELRDKAFKELKLKYPKLEFKDEWAASTEILTKFIDNFNKKEEKKRKLEEEIRMLEEQFDSSMTS